MKHTARIAAKHSISWRRVMQLKFIATAVAVFSAATLDAGAQEISPLAPGKVSISASGSTAVLNWVNMGKGVTYRVTRAPSPRDDPTTLTLEPVSSPPFTDERPMSGTSYYMVTALYPDGNSFTAAPVAFTKPDAIVAPPPELIITRPIGTTTPVASPLATPTAVNGVTVTGNTTVSATVSWSP